jgi:hypothetical protein
MSSAHMEQAAVAVAQGALAQAPAHEVAVVEDHIAIRGAHLLPPAHMNAFLCSLQVEHHPAKDIRGSFVYNVSLLWQIPAVSRRTLQPRCQAGQQSKKTGLSHQAYGGPSQ